MLYTRHCARPSTSPGIGQLYTLRTCNLLPCSVPFGAVVSCPPAAGSLGWSVGWLAVAAVTAVAEVASAAAPWWLEPLEPLEPAAGPWTMAAMIAKTAASTAMAYW